MAWENLEAEIAEELSVSRPELCLHSGGLSLKRDMRPMQEARRLVAERRAGYTVADRNRTYTVRASQHAKPKRRTA